MRTAVLGLGRMGVRHATVLNGAGLPIVAISDANSETCQKVGDAFAVEKAGRFTSNDSMLETVRPELVVIATTAPSHHDLVLKAVQCGARKILCEKPMGRSLAECKRMVEACAKAGVDLAINHQMRFMEQYLLPKQLAHSEQFGGLASVLVSAGNFGMAMNGTHYFEMFRFITDEAPVLVNAWFGDVELPNPRGAQFKDAAGTIRLETSSGRRFYMDCSGDQGHGVQVTYNCRNGRITIDELTGALDYVVRKEEYRDLPTTRYGMPVDTVARSITPADAVSPTRSVLDALLRGLDYPTGEDGLQAMRILIAAHVSNSEGGATIDTRVRQLPPDMVLPLA